MVSVETTLEAIKLRKAGYGYKEISLKLGVTVPWCCKRLKDVKKGEVDAN